VTERITTGAGGDRTPTSAYGAGRGAALLDVWRGADVIDFGVVLAVRVAQAQAARDAKTEMVERCGRAYARPEAAK